MSSILKVDTIQDQSGNNIINENADTITIGASGDTITIPSGATFSAPNIVNTPAFKAYLSANSDTLNHDTMTVVPLNAEKFDTNSKFDTSTYRFTPGEIGYYFLTGTVCIDWISGASYLRQVNVVIQKNGSPIAETIITNYNSPDMEVMGINTNVIDYSSDVTDYYQLLAYQNNGSGNNSRRMRGSSDGERTFFCGQKLIT